jgi:autotransporter-associated beta strand protein
MKTYRYLLPVAAVISALFVIASLRADDPPATPAANPAKTKEDSNITRGKLDEVTVYRGQALVTRLVEVPGAAGLHEIVVTDLPEHVQPSSIYAESADGVEVRSVLYRIRPVEQDVRDEVRKLDADIRAVQDLMQANAQQSRVLQERNEYLNKLEQFTAPTANVELTKGVLNAETLKALTTFIFDQRQTVATSQLKAQQELRDLNEKLSLLQRQREVLTGGSAKTIREAVVFVNLKEAHGRMKLRYIVDGASWIPSYNARTDGKAKITIEYNAAIEQMSGEDWTDVSMTLSTATPSLVAKAPALEPLTIALHAGVPDNMPPGSKGSISAYWSAKKDLDERRKQIEISRSLNITGANTYSGATTINGGTLVLQGNGGNTLGLNPQAGNPAEPQQQAAQQPMAQTEDFDTNLNDVARESQVLDLVNTARIERSGKPSGAPDEGVSVSYQLDGRTSLPSRADRQLIQIAAIPMKAETYRIATPVLTSAVYVQASVVNTGNRVLLAGPISTYVAGQFVGNGDVPTVAIGETFTVGLGIDTSLRAHRELAKKTESIQGGNRVVDFTYQLSVENFGAEPAQVRLFDRMPTAKENEVKLTLVSDKPALSEDPRYQQREHKKGILRWDVKVPAQAIGDKAFTLDYQMQMEYDKQLSIAGMPQAKK